MFAEETTDLHPRHIHTGPRAAAIADSSHVLFFPPSPSWSYNRSWGGESAERTWMKQGGTCLSHSPVDLLHPGPCRHKVGAQGIFIEEMKGDRRQKEGDSKKSMNPASRCTCGRWQCIPGSHSFPARCPSPSCPPCGSSTPGGSTEQPIPVSGK
ncbi:T-cell leukemia/lymphoma protein 1B isoform X2 [Macaca thibetana thibetana]|uniref:T-cell leukemia/lymphoma protein 1B isoform X2 n=1 Tax=Macaca thibetana thibetana TaxID=257877 RepID=UPI0021BC4079|nr:T-cell leukemia/lymphoma protein 1B isoform X2 [Macaca thibetana thibetana]